MCSCPGPLIDSKTSLSSRVRRWRRQLHHPAEQRRDSWCCGAPRQARADNTALLAWFRDWSGVGELFRRLHVAVSRAADRLDRRPQARLRPDRADSEHGGRRSARPRCAVRHLAAAVEAWACDGGASPAARRISRRSLRELGGVSAPAPCAVDITASDLRCVPGGVRFRARRTSGPPIGARPRSSSISEQTMRRCCASSNETFGSGHLRASRAGGQVARRVVLARRPPT